MAPRVRQERRRACAPERRARNACAARRRPAVWPAPRTGRCY